MVFYNLIAMQRRRETKMNWPTKNSLSEETNKRIDFIVKIVYYAILLGIGYLIFRFIGMVIPLVFGLLFALMFQPLIRLIHRKFRINTKVISFILMGLLYLGFAGLLYWVFVEMMHFFRDFFEGFPELFANTIEPNMIELGFWLENILVNLNIENQFDLIRWQNDLVTSISQWGLSQATSFLNSIPSFLINTLFMVLFSFFISLNYQHVKGFFINQLPDGGVELGRKLRALSKFAFIKYLKAYLIIMGITFLELVVGFYILGVNNPIGVAAVIALFDFLPVLGAGSVLFVWLIVELILGNFTFALGMTVLWLIVTIVRNIIEPKIVGKRFGVNPVAVLAAIYLGFRFFGAIGMFVVPIILQMLYVFHINGVIKLYKEKPKIVEEKEVISDTNAREGTANDGTANDGTANDGIANEGIESEAVINGEGGRESDIPEDMAEKEEREDEEK